MQTQSTNFWPLFWLLELCLIACLVVIAAIDEHYYWEKTAAFLIASLKYHGLSRTQLNRTCLAIYLLSSRHLLSLLNWEARKPDHFNETTSQPNLRETLRERSIPRPRPAEQQFDLFRARP